MDNAWDGNPDGVQFVTALISQILQASDFCPDQTSHGFALSAFERYHTFIERLAPFSEKRRGEFGAAEINSNHSVVEVFRFRHGGPERFTRGGIPWER